MHPITIALIVAAVAIMFALFGAAAQRTVKPDPETGELVLRCSGVMVWFFVVLAVMPVLFFSSVLLVIPRPDALRAIPYAAGFGGLYLLTCGSCAVWAAARKTCIDPEGLTSVYVLGGSTHLTWAEVARVSYKGGLKGWVHGKNGEKVLLYLWFVGVRNAVPMLWRHLPEGVLRESRHALQRLAKAANVDPKVPRPAVWETPANSTLPTFPGRGA